MLISELSELQKSHLAFRLDSNTYCGLITASKVAKGLLGNFDLVEVFRKFGGRTSHSAKIHARKVINYPNPRITIQIKQSGDHELLELLRQHILAGGSND